MLLAAAPPARPPNPEVEVAKLVGAALTDGLTYARVEDLSDRIGPRLSGSKGAANAVLWAKAQLEAEGLKPVLEPVEVPHWVRGEERGEISSDLRFGAMPLALTALGGCGATPAEGLTAEVVEVDSLQALAALGEKARGKIVYFTHHMAGPQDYGQGSVLRTHGANAAAKLGAVAMLVRSLSTASLRAPHTGMTAFDPGVAPIPAAALALADSERLHRALAGGPVKVHLVLTPKILPDADSFNVVAQVNGREKPEEIVEFSAHLDSWDLAQGAEDDAAGVAMVLEAARLISRLSPPPRRTVRFVLYMNEENGQAGGKAYAKAHASELSRHVAALEADFGAARPMGIGVHAGPGAEAVLAALARPLATLGAGSVVAGHAGGADVDELEGVPLVSVRQDGTHYFDVHHSAADTLDHIRPLELALASAAWTALTYQLAESTQLLPRPAK